MSLVARLLSCFPSWIDALAHVPRPCDQEGSDYRGWAGASDLEPFTIS